MPENGNNASYRYTAEEQREIDSLRQKYAGEPSGDHLEELREIDRRVTRRSTVWAVLIGIAGTLVFCVGLTLVLTFDLMLPGIIVGCVGIAAMAAMPALYGEILRWERRKATPHPGEDG
ncbi:MAG: hypothetical protein IJI26_09480 [Clostridia bacterium]|nr:hypothetical protein [Clostridia bacterium]